MIHSSAIFNLLSATLTVAPHSPLSASEPPPLVSPSPFTEFLTSATLESPGAWVTAFTLLAAGLALLTRTRRKFKVGGAVLLALAIGIGILQRVVITDHEAIVQSSQAAARAVGRAEGTALQGLLASDFKATYTQAPQGLSKEETIRRAVDIFRDHPTEITISETRAIVDNARFARAQIQVTARNDHSGGYPIASWWILNWEKTDSGWQLTSAELFSSSIPMSP